MKNRNGNGHVIELRPNSNRQKVLQILSANKNRVVPAARLARRVYGDARRLAPLRKVIFGLDIRLKKERAGHRIKKVTANGSLLYLLS